MGLLGSDPQCWESSMSTLGSLFPTGETIGSVGSSWYVSVLAWGLGEVMWSECSHPSYPSKAVLLSLCGPGVASASPLGSRIFTLVPFLWIVASWSSHEGNYVTILICTNFICNTSKKLGGSQHIKLLVPVPHISSLEITTLSYQQVKS